MTYEKLQDDSRRVNPSLKKIVHVYMSVKQCAWILLYGLKMFDASEMIQCGRT